MTETLAGGRYNIVRRLAQGGMGDVLLADFPGDTQRSVTPGLVVVKRVLTDHPNHMHQAAMLREEGRVALRLLHDNLVETFFVDEHQGDPLLVMEYLSGRAMSQVLGQAKKRKELVPVDNALALLRAAACGLHFAHTLTDRGRPLGLIHRDVSPANLFVTFDGRVKVIDFGVAKADDSEIRTSTGILKGKLGYMSPEHALGEKLTPGADMWSLGVLFWETLCAERLFAHAAPSATLQAISEKPIPLPTLHRPDLPKGVADLCMRLLERRLDKRINTGAGLVKAIDALPEAKQLPRVDLGGWLSGRFPEEAGQGRQEAGRCARMRRRTPVPIGLVEGTAASVASSEEEAPTLVIGAAAAMKAIDMLAGEDGGENDVATVRMKLGDMQGDPGDDAPTKRMGRNAGLLADSDSSPAIAEPASTMPDSIDIEMTRTAQLPNLPPTDRGGSMTVQQPATKSRSGLRALSTTMPNLERGSSWVAVAFLTFGALALAMGVAFSYVEPVQSVRSYAAYDDGTGQNEVVVAIADAPPSSRQVDAGAPEILVAGQMQKLDPAEFDRLLTQSGVRLRASMPQTPRGLLAMLLPVLIAGLGMLALAAAVPALVVTSRRLRVVAQLALFVACAVVVAGVVKRGALSWPGLDATGAPAKLEVSKLDAHPPAAPSPPPG